jgi:hypothetical protein
MSLRRNTIAFWILLVTTVGLLLAENLLHFRLSVPAMSELSGGLPLLDMRIGYSPDDVYRLFDALGATGRDAYRDLFLSIDILIPLSISAFLWFAISKGPLRRYRALGLAGGAFDYLENAAILILLAGYPQRNDPLATFAAVFTVLKFCFYTLGLALAVAGYLLRRRRNR